MSLERDMQTLLDVAKTRSIHDSVVKYGDLRASIDSFITASRQQLALSHDQRFPAQSALAETPLKRYKLFGSPHCLEETVSLYRGLFDAADYTPFSSWRVDVLDGLGSALSGRFEQNTYRADIDEGISLHEQSIALRTGLGTSLKPSLLGLGVSHLLRGMSAPFGFKEDFSQAVDLITRAVDVSRSEGTDVSASLCYLSFALREYNRGTSERAPAVHAAWQAVESAPIGHENHAFALIAAARSLIEPPITADMISLCRDAYDLGHAIHHPYYALAGVAFSTFTIKQNTFQDVTVVSDAFAVLRGLYGAHSYRHIATKVIITSFSWGLIWMYDMTGKLEYLDEAIAVQMQNCRMNLLEERPFRPWLQNLAAALEDRYHLTGSLDDLNEAISFAEVCVSLISDTPAWGEIYYVNELGSLLLARYQHGGNGADLQRALELHRISFKAISKSESYDWKHLGAASRSISVLQHTPRDIVSDDEIKETIHVYSRILEAVKPSEPYYTESLTEFSLCLRLLSERTGDTSYVAQAVSVQQNTIPLIAFHAAHMTALAQNHLCLWRLAGDAQQFQLAMKAFAEAVRQPLSPVRVRFKSAIAWCEAVVDAEPDIISDAYNCTLEILPRAVMFGGDIRTKLEALRRAPGLSVDAAMHALEFESPAHALSLLERGRAVWWTQALTSRKPLKDLPATVGQELGDISRVLEMRTDADVSLARREELMSRLAKLVIEARTFPGYDNFLKSPPISHIQTAIGGAIVVALVCISASAAAIMLQGHEAPTALTLGGLNRGCLETWASSFNADLAMRHAEDSGGFKEARKLVKQSRPNDTKSPLYDLLRRLWDMIGSPIVRALNLKRNGLENRPRMFLCSSGPFALLPLHAAGRYGDSVGECFSDYAVISYTPTLTALVNASDNPPVHPMGTKYARTVLAAVPAAPLSAPLPNTSAESDTVQRLIPQTSALHGEVSIDDVLAELPSAAFLHLACHGKHDSDDPLSSGFVFQDGMLTLSRLMDIQVPNACFAFLSACESARGDKKIPDENIHLAAAMIFLGYRSVVGTLWSMHDADGPKVAERVYTELMKNTEKFDYDRVPRALDMAVRELRQAGVHPSRWATCICMGI